MKNFFIGILLTILVIIAWPNISQMIDDTAVNSQPRIPIVQPSQSNSVPRIEEVIKPLAVSPTVAAIEDMRAKQRESLQESIENDPNRRGRNGD